MPVDCWRQLTGVMSKSEREKPYFTLFFLKSWMLKDAFVTVQPKLQNRDSLKDFL